MRITIGLSALLLYSCVLSAQSPSDSISTTFSVKAQAFEKGMAKQVANTNSEITQKSIACLQKLTSLEAKLKSKLSAVDPASKQSLFNFPIEKDFAKLGSDLTSTGGNSNGSSVGVYLPYLDSSSVGLKFLSGNAAVLAKGPQIFAKYQTELNAIQQLKGRLQVSENIQAAISARKEQILRYLNHFKKLPARLSEIYNS